MGDKVYKIVLYTAEIAGMTLLRLFRTSARFKATKRSSKGHFFQLALAELWVLGIKFSG